MKQYHNLVKKIINTGVQKGDRTGNGTIGIFGHQMRFDMHDGFPLLTTKKTHWHSVITELVWFLRGDTNIKFLKDNNVSIWDEWADKNGDLGDVYGKQWRSWDNGDGTVTDQIKNVIENIKNTPDCRRLIVSAWNPSVVPDSSKSFEENIKNGKQALPPCHLLFQFYTIEAKYYMHEGFVSYDFNGRTHKTQYTKMTDVILLPQRILSVQLYQRSGDTMLGIPFNIASYSALLHVIAHFTNSIAGEFIHTIGDAHIYLNHVEKTKEKFLPRNPEKIALPKISISPSLKNIDDLDISDVIIEGYEHQGGLIFDIAI